MIRIQEILFASPLYPASQRFREEVLRLPLGLRLTVEDTLGEESQTHIVALAADDAVVGTVLLKPVSDERVKLRQMAVSPTIQKAGVGKMLVQFAEDVAYRRQIRFIELNARISARGFYEKLGYCSEGDIFVEVTVPTVRMTKRLSDSLVETLCE